MHDRDYIYESQFEKIKLKDMEDTHIINVIHYENYRIKKDIERIKRTHTFPELVIKKNIGQIAEFRKRFIQEARYRKLNIGAMLKKAPFPFKRNGIWYRWNGKRSVRLPNTFQFLAEE
jgi:hypothetical protein